MRMKKIDNINILLLWKKMILNYSHNGCVMLLHAVSKDNTEVLGDIIDELRNREYEFYSLDNFER